MKTDIETKLTAAIADEVPDVLDKILAGCGEKEVLAFEPHEQKISRRNWIKPVCTAAAAIALIAGGCFGFEEYRIYNTVESVITLDVNPSVELKANKENIVLSASGINEDGRTVLDGIEKAGVELKGMALDKAVTELVSSMVDGTYLSELNNSVLVSVENFNSERGTEIETRLVTEIDIAISEKGIGGAVLGQSGKADEDISVLAFKYGISSGKANLIEKLITSDSQLSFGELAGLSISELGLLAEKRLGASEDLIIIGSPGGEKYLSPDSAVEKACADADITEGSSAETAASIELKDGRLIYEVSVTTENAEYKYDVDVKTGEILDCVTKILKSVSDAVGPDRITENAQSGTPGVGQEFGQSGDTAGADAVAPTEESAIEAAEDVLDIITDITEELIGENFSIPMQ